MSSFTELLFAKDLLNWTAENLKNGRVFEVQDPSNLTEVHFKKLQDLGYQRDQMALSTAVDTNELETKLKHVSSRSTSRSTSIFTSRFTPGSDDSQELERDLHKEKEAHGALIQEGEPLEKKFEQAQKGLESAQTKLSEAGAAGFEGEYELNSISWALQNGQQKEEADGEMKLAEQDMELAEQQLETAESDGFRNTAERSALIGLAQREVKPAEKRLND
ncbi:MAG: hypothetical protein FRX48_01159 [Lasallia pustulata]|uniref:Uncharacterized protein n=1 Tax=Lasallia pustulata TaxID=136370 RepID=A0A5M8PZB7_9LECA|nr:MAG: hypothetical protein FRX48_01159 [Lasallia pustulata]